MVSASQRQPKNQSSVSRYRGTSKTISASHRGMFKSTQFVKEPEHRVELVRRDSKIVTEHTSGVMVHLSGTSRSGDFWSSRLFFGGGQHGKSGSWFV
jgi:hypothetical protein